MKVLVLTDFYPPHYTGGYELFCEQIVEVMRAHGHDVTVLTTSYGLPGKTVEGHVHRVLDLIDLRHDTWLQRRVNQFKKACHAINNYRITRRLARQIEPDIAYVFHLLRTTVTPAYATHDLGIPGIYLIGSHWLVHWRREFIEETNPIKRLYRTALMGFQDYRKLQFDGATVISQSLMDEYEAVGFDMSRAVLVPSGIPDDWIADAPPPPRSPDDPLRLAYIGRYDPAKGPAVPIKALAHLARQADAPAVTLDLIGPEEASDYKRQLRKLVADSGLEGTVHFLNFMPRVELIRHYRDYDVLIFPTLRYEGLGTTNLEAMSQGLVVIASNIGGPRDLIEDGRNGLLVPPGDPAALAEAITRVARNPALAVELGRAALRTIRIGYTETILEHHFAVYLETLHRDGPLAARDKIQAMRDEMFRE